MKPRLMFHDRDFDPDEAFRDLMYRYRPPNQRPELPADWQDLAQDLEVATLLQAMAGNDDFVYEVVQEALFSAFRNDVPTILYRQEVINDCLRNPATVQQLYSLSVEAIEATRRKCWSLSSGYASSLLYDSIDMLAVLSGMLRRLRTLAEEHAGRFDSRAFTTLFAMARAELDDEYLASIERHLTELKFRDGVLLSAQLGNWNESAGLTLRKLTDKRLNWLERLLGKRPPGHTFQLAERDEAGARILSNIRQRGISRVAIALARSAEHVLTFFRALRTELAFYIGCLNLHGRLAMNGEPVCIPTPALTAGREHHFTGLYDVCLSLRMDTTVVGNSVDADGKDLVIVTGANQGGKSTFLRAIGLAQLMMQAGMFVGAESFSAQICASLFTHYKREEDAALKSGKFDEELVRMSRIAERIRPNSMLLFNESFSATNEREGSEIARQIVSALLEKGVKIFFVTHLYEFARAFFERSAGGVLFLRAERKTDGTRTFRLIEGEPLETSYGQDLYRQIFAAEEQLQLAGSGKPDDRVNA